VTTKKTHFGRAGEYFAMSELLLYSGATWAQTGATGAPVPAALRR
jgi:hypothetical protein